MKGPLSARAGGQAGGRAPTSPGSSPKYTENPSWPSTSAAAISPSPFFSRFNTRRANAREEQIVELYSVRFTGGSETVLQTGAH